jgi:hypothetical protein
VAEEGKIVNMLSKRRKSFNRRCQVLPVDTLILCAEKLLVLNAERTFSKAHIVR